MDKAEITIVGGFSAGGQAVFYWINYIGDLLKSKNPNMIIKGFCDGGIFLD